MQLLASVVEGLLSIIRFIICLPLNLLIVTFLTLMLLGEYILNEPPKNNGKNKLLNFVEGRESEFYTIFNLIEIFEPQIFVCSLIGLTIITILKSF